MRRSWWRRDRILRGSACLPGRTTPGMSISARSWSRISPLGTPYCQLEDEHGFEDDGVGDADLELARFDPPQVGGGSGRLGGVVLKEMAEEDLAVQEAQVNPSGLIAPQRPPR